MNKKLLIAIVILVSAILFLLLYSQYFHKSELTPGKAGRETLASKDSTSSEPQAGKSGIHPGRQEEMKAAPSQTQPKEPGRRLSPQGELALLKKLPPKKKLELLEKLSPQEQQALMEKVPKQEKESGNEKPAKLETMSPQEKLAMLEKLPPKEKLKLMERVSPQEKQALLEKLSPQEQQVLMERVSPQEKQALLEKIPLKEKPSAAQEPSSPLVIDYGALLKGNSGTLGSLMAERKKRWGLDKSVDAIVTGDEKIKLGEFELSLADISRQLKIAEGEIVVEDLTGARPSVRKTLTYFGVHLVRPNENLWNIHFAILREYLAANNIKVSPMADEPNPSGKSSGVGKVLKFSESMVKVFNLETGSPPADLNVLSPGTEVVIFNMTPIFRLMKSIDFAKIDHIQFNGRLLYFEPS